MGVDDVGRASRELRGELGKDGEAQRVVPGVTVGRLAVEQGRHVGEDYAAVGGLMQPRPEPMRSEVNRERIAERSECCAVVEAKQRRKDAGIEAEVALGRRERAEHLTEAARLGERRDLARNMKDSETRQVRWLRRNSADSSGEVGLM